MNSTTNEWTDKNADWKEAAAASAEAQKDAGVREKFFVEKLPVKLSDKEIRAAGRRLADSGPTLERYDEETKTLIADRKAARAQIEARAAVDGDMVRTERTEREVRCVERISFALNRKWRVRLDTNETYEEDALSNAERQAELPIADDKQLSLGGVGDDDSDGDSEESDVAEDDDDLIPTFDDSTNIGEHGPDASSSDVTDPDGVLSGEAGGPPQVSTPPSKPSRKRKK